MEWRISVGIFSCNLYSLLSNRPIQITFFHHLWSWQTWDRQETRRCCSHESVVVVPDLDNQRWRYCCSSQELATAVLIAVASSGTSTENIPLPRWCTLFDDFFFLDRDARTLLLFPLLDLRHDDRFIRVGVMIYNKWWRRNTRVPFIDSSLAQRVKKEPINVAFPEPIAIFRCLLTNHFRYSWTNQIQWRFKYKYQRAIAMSHS